jgi:hypothetical protein
MVKIIELTLDNGEIWEIPLEFVARNRAEYYKSKNEEDFNYQEEIDFIMEDNYEGIDWLQNNMDYEDFKEVIVIKKVENKEIDWINAEASIIDN